MVEILTGKENAPSLLASTIWRYFRWELDSHRSQRFPIRFSSTGG